MKDNKVNIVELTQDLLNAFNKQNKDAKVEKMYSIDIKKSTTSFDSPSNDLNNKKGGKRVIRELNLYMHNLKTGERVVLYKTDYIPKNPIDLVRVNYTYILYRQLYYFLLAFFTVNIEKAIAIQKEDETEEMVKNTLEAKEEINNILNVE